MNDSVTPVMAHVAPEGRDFVHDPGVVENTNGAELDAMRHRPPEQGLHLGWRRRGGKIPVGVCLAQQRVAHGASNAPRLESRLGELPDWPRHPEPALRG